MDIRGLNENIPLPLIQDSARAKSAPKETVRAIPDKNGSEKPIQQLIENMNEFMQSMNYSIRFVPDTDSGRVVIKVLDGEGKLIRQIPPEVMAGISGHLGGDIGLILNEMMD